MKEIQNEFIRFMEEKYKVFNKYSGILKEDFLQIMKAIQENKILQGKAFLKLDNDDFNRIFDMFDYNNSGTLDFRFKFFILH